MVSTKEQVAEAIERMKLLKLHENAIKEFKSQRKVNFSKGIGILYWVEDEYEKFVREFELKHNAVVYHCIYSLTDFGEMLAMLYVSNSPEEWESDRLDIKDGIVFAYVKNISDDYCSEFGSIGIRPSIGGLIRTS